MRQTYLKFLWILCAMFSTHVAFGQATPSCVPSSSSWTNYVTPTVFSYTGTVQSWTVPTAVTSVYVDAQGAQGGGVSGYDTYQSIGGNGGRVQATYSVTPGNVLHIVVGGQGAHTAGTAGYGGGGADSHFTATWPGAGGGGASIVIDNTAVDTLLFAGGGGGGGGDVAGGDNGGAGGGLTGGSGASNLCTTGGLGGTQTAGGTGESCSGDVGGNGSLGRGGSYTSTTALGSGGGGGGYYGGGAGSYGGGGGGGSSFTNSTYASAVTHTQGYNSGGNGVVKISQLYNQVTYGINTFFITASTGANLDDTGIVASASATTGYLDHTSLSPVTLYQGDTASSYVVWGTASSHQEAQVWIDFNDDGIFQTTEEVSLSLIHI